MILLIIMVYQGVYAVYIFLDLNICVIQVHSPRTIRDFPSFLGWVIIEDEKLPIEIEIEIP